MRIVIAVFIQKVYVCLDYSSCTLRKQAYYRNGSLKQRNTRQGEGGEMNTISRRLALALGLVLGSASAKEPPQPLVLEPMGTVAVPTVRGQKHWFLGNGAKVSYYSSTFMEYFFGKSEPPVEAHAMTYVVLRQSVPDAPILEALGGEAAVEVTLSELFAVLEQQPKGGEGALSIDPPLNVFYVRDKKGVLRTVFVYWDHSGDKRQGWGLNAGPIGKRPWSLSSRIFLRSKPSSPE